MTDDTKNTTEDAQQVLRQQLEELDYNWKRALADYQNLQKRFEEEKEQVVTLANMSLLSGLVPIYDNLLILQKHTTDKGLEMIVKEFKQLLTDFGLEKLDVLGKDFNPETMEAVEVIEGEQNRVVEVVQNGYLLNGKLLKPARVKVGGKPGTD